VFQLDFGRIGCQICFDLGFPETWEELKSKGAEVVFWPSAYDGGFPLRLHAYLHSYYVVSAVWTANSRIINPLAEVLACTTPGLRVVSYTIDLDYMICHLDFHWNIPEELKKAYGAGVTVRVAQEDGVFLVESNRNNLPLAKLVKKHGLEAAKVYFSRHYPMYEALRSGRKPKPQETPYRDRKQYS